MDKEELLHDLKNIQTMLKSFDFHRADIHLTMLINDIAERGNK